MQVIKAKAETVSQHRTIRTMFCWRRFRLRLYRHDTKSAGIWRRQRVTTLAVYRFCAGGLVLRRDAGGRRGDGTRHLWMARNYPQRPSLCALYGFAGYVATPRRGGGAHPEHGYALWSALCRAFTPAICCI